MIRNRTVIKRGDYVTFATEEATGSGKVFEIITGHDGVMKAAVEVMTEGRLGNRITIVHVDYRKLIKLTDRKLLKELKRNIEYRRTPI